MSPGRVGGPRAAQSKAPGGDSQGRQGPHGGKTGGQWGLGTSLVDKREDRNKGRTNGTRDLMGRENKMRSKRAFEEEYLLNHFSEQVFPYLPS